MVDFFGIDHRNYAGTAMRRDEVIVAIELMKYTARRRSPPYPNVRLLGTQPALREDVADRAGNSLITLPRADRCENDHIVRTKMPLVNRVIRSSELNRTTSVLPG